MRIKIQYIFFFLLLGIGSCQEKEISIETDKDISFQVLMPELGITKGEITENNLGDIYVYGFKTNNTQTGVKFLDNAKLIKDTQNNIWKPANAPLWEANSEYSFFGYTYTPAEKGSDASITLKKDLNNNYGSSFDIVQSPTDYTKTIDYLLSYKVIYPPSTSYPLVPIHLEHAMSKVSFVVTRDETIKSVTLTLSGIKNKSSISCDKQKDIREEKVSGNTWTFITDAESTATYTATLGTVTKNTTSVAMSFIAIPVINTDLEKYLLKVHFETIEGVQYDKEFILSNHTVMWPHNTHIEYRINLDDDINLEGSIKDWNNVDFIEGTILPPEKK